MGFNAAIPGIVQSKANVGKHVHLVDMHSALTTADLIDGVHPTSTGYDKVAAAWYTALRSVPGSIGTAGTDPTSSALISAASGRCLDVPGSNASNGVQPIIWDCNGRANQRWNANANATVSNASNGLCLDVSGNSSANGTPVILWNCTAAANQRWTRS